MQTGENSIREAHTLYHSNLYSLHSALICSKIQVYDVMVGYNSSFLYSIWTPPFLAPFKSFTNCKDFPRSLNGESDRGSHPVCKFGKQIARCSNTSKAKLQITY